MGVEQGLASQVERPQRPPSDALAARIAFLHEAKPETVAILIPVDLWELEQAETLEDAARAVLQEAYDRLMNP